MEKTKKTYLIIGGTSGIGLQIAKDLSKDSNCVVIVGNDRGDTSFALQLLPNKNYGFTCDLREKTSVEQIFEFVHKNHLILDGLVYCAGISPLMLVSENDYRLMVDTFLVNVLSFIESVKFFCNDEIRKPTSSVVAISSIAASQSSNRQTVYSASKAALEASVRCMAKELLLKGVRVNAVALGAVRTELFERLEKENPNLENRYPLGAIPLEQVSSLIRYLLSQESSHMTGSIVKMDAGHDVWMK